LSRNKKQEVREFVEEQLRKGYIHPSKLPQTLPVFFREKKDRKKRMVQDYQYLNKGTIKDNYPLPLISDLIDTMGTKKKRISERNNSSHACKSNGTRGLIIITIGGFVFEGTICLVCFITSFSLIMLFLLLLREVFLWLLLLSMRALLLFILGVLPEIWKCLVH